MKPLGRSFTYVELGAFLEWVVDTYQSSEEIKEFLTGTQLIRGVAVPNYPDINTTSIGFKGKT